MFSGGCRDPEEVLHTTKSGAQSPFNTRDRVTFTCDECYYGGGHITCKEDGQWTDYPVCYGEVKTSYALGLVAQLLVSDKQMGHSYVPLIPGVLSDVSGEGFL